MARSTKAGFRLAGGVVLAAAFLLAPGLSTLRAEDAPAHHAAESDGRPGAQCPAQPRVEVVPAVAIAGGVQQRVGVSVPATALIRVDRHGRVLAAATNTGCAPRAGDTFWLVLPDGSLRPAAARRFAHRHWTGDFSAAGVFVPQHH